MDHIGIDVHKRESCGSCGSGSCGRALCPRDRPFPMRRLIYCGCGFVILALTLSLTLAPLVETATPGLPAEGDGPPSDEWARGPCGATSPTLAEATHQVVPVP